MANTTSAKTTCKLLMTDGGQSTKIRLCRSRPTLEAADDHLGVACLGGECFGAAGQGFLRFSCAEPDDRLRRAVAFLAEAATRTERVEQYLRTNPHYRLA